MFQDQETGMFLGIQLHHPNVLHNWDMLIFCVWFLEDFVKHHVHIHGGNGSLPKVSWPFGRWHQLDTSWDARWFMVVKPKPHREHPKTLGKWHATKTNSLERLSDLSNLSESIYNFKRFPTPKIWPLVCNLLQEGSYTGAVISLTMKTEFLRKSVAALKIVLPPCFARY